MPSQRGFARTCLDALALLGVVWLLPFAIIVLGAPVVLLVRIVLEVAARL